MKPCGFYSLSALGSQTPALQGSSLPRPGRAPVFAGTHLHLLDITLRLQDSSTGSSRTGKSEQHLLQGWSRTRLAHRTKATEWGIHLPCTEPSEDRLQECISDPPTRGNQAGGSCGIHPSWLLPMPAFSPTELRDAQHLWFLQWHIPAFHMQQSCHHCREHGVTKPFISSSFIYFKLS